MSPWFYVVGYIVAGFISQYVYVLAFDGDKPGTDPPAELVGAFWPLFVGFGSIAFVVWCAYKFLQLPKSLAAKSRELPPVYRRWREKKAEPVGTPDGRLSLGEDARGHVSITEPHQ